MKNILLTVFIVTSFSSLVMAQMPQTDIYLLNYEPAENELNILSIKKISQGLGYNNQPYLASGCTFIYYTSNVFDSSQTEILQYDIQAGTTTRLTNNLLSEYSPGIRPDNGGLSHVRVESDKKQHLRLLFDSTGMTENLIPSTDSVGYYSWNGSKDLGLIILNKGLEFHTYRLGDSQTHLVSDSVGRFISKAKNESAFWYHFKSNNNPQLISYDFVNKTVKQKIQPLNGCDDYGVDHVGNIFGGSNGVLFKYNDGFWKPVADLNADVGQFYRMNFCDCGKHMCVVSYSGKKP